MNIRASFGQVGFTPEEKLDLTARLERAAEEELMTNTTKRRIKRISGGMVFGIAAAAIMTVGTLAAVINPNLRTWFGGQEGLERSIYRLDRSQTYNGWTVTLDECVGDDYSAYIWVDLTAPEGTALAPPENGSLEVTYRMEDMEGIPLIQTMSLEQIPDPDPTDNRMSFLLEYSWTGESLRGETFNIIINPIYDYWYSEADTSKAQRFEVSELTAPICDHEWVFEGVTLDFPDQTIRLQPNVEVPWLDGAVTVTRLDISPISVRVDIEGGACATYDRLSTPAPFVPGEPDETVTAKDGSVIRVYDGATVREGSEAGIDEALLTLGGETFIVRANNGYYKFVLPDGTEFQSKRPEDDSYAAHKRAQEMLEAFTTDTVLKDGTTLTAQANVYSNSGTREGVDGAETCFRTFARRYSEINSGPAGSVDPAQVDHVTICGIDIPVAAEEQEA